MTRVANRFTNPLTGAIYDWPLNHETEEDLGKRNSLEVTFNTGSGLPVFQQGNSDPMTLRFEGRALTEAHITNLWGWFGLTRTQTVYFRDFAGDEYEVIITDFRPRRIRAAKNLRDLTNAPLNTWTYTIEMTIIRVRSGPLLAAGITQ